MSKLSQTNYGTGRFNRSLYELRESRGWTQKQMGEAIGYFNNHTVMRVENGISGGKLDFWQAVQKAFNIPDEAMWSLMNGDYERYNSEVNKHGTNVNI